MLSAGQELLPDRQNYGLSEKGCQKIKIIAELGEIVD